MSELSGWAVELAEGLIAGALPERWAHDEGVIAKAHGLGEVMGEDADLLVAAAALHDLGHAPVARSSGYQPLDSVWYLEALDVYVPKRLIDLIANNAAGWIEAELRGLGAHYERHPDEGSPVRDALWWCCLTTLADGTDGTLAQRVKAWDTYYAGDDVIRRYAKLALPELEQALERTERRRAGAVV